MKEANGVPPKVVAQIVLTYMDNGTLNVQVAPDAIPENDFCVLMSKGIVVGLQILARAAANRPKLVLPEPVMPTKL